MNPKKIIAQILLTAIEVCGIYYFMLPALSWHSKGFWNFLMLGLIISFANGIIYHLRKAKNDLSVAKIDDGIEFIVQNIVGFSSALLLALLIIANIIVSFSGSKMIRYDEYADLISISEEQSFETDFVFASESLISVDQKTAQKLGDRTIGTIFNASWFEVDDEYNLCLINGEYYRISPINYSGFFAQNKAVKNGGIPGYVAVNAKTQEAKVVYFEKGMKYSPSGYFSYDLTRNIRKDFKTELLGSSFFEVDEDNNPYWITAVLETTIGLRGGKVQTGVVITDAVTGENTYYAIKDLPEWVDHAYSVSYLMERIQWHYQFQNGYWNFSKTNRYKTTYSYRTEKNSSEENAATPFDGYNSILSNEGEILFVTGITPENSAETNIGFVTVSARTGKVNFYAVEGAEESSAQAAAEGLVQNLRYSASFPVLVNVSGEETYFMVLKDDAGLVKKYALCNVKNYTICVEADSISEAISKYLVATGKKAEEELDINEDNNVETEANVETKIEKSEGNVKSVKEAQIKGYTFYYFTLENDDMIYMSSIQNSNLQPMKLIVGSSVKIEYYISESENGIGIVTKIDF